MSEPRRRQSPRLVVIKMGIMELGALLEGEVILWVYTKCCHLMRIAWSPPLPPVDDFYGNINI